MQEGSEKGKGERGNGNLRFQALESEKPQITQMNADQLGPGNLRLSAISAVLRWGRLGGSPFLPPLPIGDGIGFGNDASPISMSS